MSKWRRKENRNQRKKHVRVGFTLTAALCTFHLFFPNLQSYWRFKKNKNKGAWQRLLHFERRSFHLCVCKPCWVNRGVLMVLIPLSYICSMYTVTTRTAWIMFQGQSLVCWSPSGLNRFKNKCRSDGFVGMKMRVTYKWWVWPTTAQSSLVRRQSQTGLQISPLSANCM